jgi:hypothetical protein
MLKNNNFFVFFEQDIFKSIRIVSLAKKNPFMNDTFALFSLLSHPGVSPPIARQLIQLLGSAEAVLQERDKTTKPPRWCSGFPMEKTQGHKCAKEIRESVGKNRKGKGAVC